MLEKTGSSFARNANRPLTGVAEHMRIGISGGRGSFTEEAANEHCKLAQITGPRLEYLTFVEQVLEALEKGTIDIGIFAIENSNGGVVLEYLPAIGKHRFDVIKTFEIPVHHMLLVLPGKKREDVKVITSQKQALLQCRLYLRRMWPNTEISEYIDTATSAKDLAEGVLPPETAVVASRACAKLYDLEILEESIQDSKFNFTTFIVASRLD